MNYVFFGNNVPLAERLRKALGTGVIECITLLQMKNTLLPAEEMDYCVFIEKTDPTLNIPAIMHLHKTFQNIYIVLIAPEMTREEKNKRVDEMMTLVGIPPQRKKSFPHEFSGGMKQRVVIAMALVAEPELLLADEPTTALDVTIQAQILRLMNELQEEKGTSIIFITHDLGVINEMADDVAVMYCGQVVEKASARTIFSDCKMSHPYTEGLMFSIPRLDSKDKIEPIPGVVPHPLALPKGCKFAPRCKYCTKKCMEEEPELKDMGNGQLIRCFYPEKEVRRSAAHKEITVNH